MKILICLFIALLQFQSLFSEQLKIATFNCEFLIKKKVHVKFGIPYDIKQASSEIQAFWADESNREKKFLEAVQHVAGHIKIIDADIIGLTEVGKKEEVEILVKTLRGIGLDYKFWEVCKSLDRSTGQHVAILSKYKLKDVQQSFNSRGLFFIEDDLDEVDETGISKGMQVTVKFNNKDIHLLLLHLVSERGNNNTDKQRIKQAEIIRTEVLPLIENGEDVIIMGDFNSERGHEVLLTLRGFRDVGQELIQTGNDDYFKNFSTRWTFEFNGEREQIDHILCSIPLSKKCYVNTKSRFGMEAQIVPTNDPKISDHNAFVVNLLFKK